MKPIKLPMHHSVEFKANVKAHTAPQIVNSYHEEDTGELMHTLSSGNSISDANYSKMWGVPKGKILPKGTRDNTPDPRTNWIK